MHMHVHPREIHILISCIWYWDSRFERQILILVKWKKIDDDAEKINSTVGWHSKFILAITGVSSISCQYIESGLMYVYKSVLQHRMTMIVRARAKTKWMPRVRDKATITLNYYVRKVSLNYSGCSSVMQTVERTKNCDTSISCKWNN